MTARHFASIVVGLFLALAVSSTARADKGGPSVVDKPAPDFTLKTLEGKDVKLSALKGDVVVLDFWATWCPPCRKSLPHLNKIAHDSARADKGLKVFAVNCREAKGKAKAYVDKSKLTFEVLLDQAGAAMQAYAVQAIPTTVLIGRDGEVKKVFTGYGGKAGEAQLDAAIDKLLEQPKSGK